MLKHLLEADNLMPERFSNQGEFIKVTEARLTYVAIDADGKPTPVPER